jgi:SAM-dependent methyltransferase
VPTDETDRNPTPSMAHQEFLDLAVEALVDGSFRRLVFAKPRSAEYCPRITIRPVVIRDQQMLSIVQSFPTNDITKNVATHLASETLRPLIFDAYLRSHLTTGTAQIDLSVTKKGAASIHRSQVTPTVGSNDVSEPNQSHDRAKQRMISMDRPYLLEVGITDRQGRIVPAMARKWKQINKFVEIVDGAISASSLKDSDVISVVDFGAGKGYLTFGLYDHLSTTLGTRALVTGVEIRPELVHNAGFSASALKADGLRFVLGDIETADVSGDINILVALHACDTATDAAIFRGISAGSQVIVCSPCCHKELRPQINVPAVLFPMLGHGVHLGQEADMVTDTLRALLLEQHGYDSKVFEFIGLEDTSKNKMILAVRRQQPDPKKQASAAQQIADLKAFYGIKTQHLETLLTS